MAFPSDANYTSILDLSGIDELYADPEGNLLYAEPGNGTLFAVVSGYVEGDAANRFFHYYADTMRAYNVSRFRLSDEEHIPLTSDYVALAPLNYDARSTTPDVYIAIDTAGSVFFPVTCDIQDQPSKVFLVADVTTGIEKLQDPSLRYTVTGGRVQKCYVLPLAAPAGSADIALAASSNSTTATNGTTTSAAPSPRA